LFIRSSVEPFLGALAMKKHHATILLLTLFFTGLIVLWWAEYAEIPTTQEFEATRGLIFPRLRKVSAAEVRRVEVIQHRYEDEREGQPPTRLVFERRAEGWQMLEPLNAAADPSRIDTLVQNVKNLSSAPDAGTIVEPARNFGLEPPAATVKLFGSEADTPLAALEVGKAVRDRLYVRPIGGTGVEVVDTRLQKGVGEPVSGWRERSIFNLASFQVGGIAVSAPEYTLKAERQEGHWRLLSPIHVLADDLKVEEVLGELTSLRVLAGPEGFVAEDARDLARYGLDAEHATRIELVPALRRGLPQTLLVGKPAPGDDDRVYAMRSDQDDVVLVRGADLRRLGADPNALRSKKVADLTPGAASFVRVTTRSGTFEASRSGRGWTLIKPAREPADEQTLSTLLTSLDSLEWSEVFSPDKVRDPGVDPPLVRLEVWQLRPGERPAATPPGEPTNGPRLDLAIGRHDAGKKTVFARLAGDRSVLALPDQLLDVLPETTLAFRERTLVQVGPASVTRLTFDDPQRKLVLGHPTTGAPNVWQMQEPVVAPADDEAVTKALLVLSNFRALRFVAERPEDLHQYGLDRPSLRVSWTTSPGASEPGAGTEPTTTSLVLGSRVPRSEAWYGRLSTSPLVFTVSDALILPFRAEFRSRQVLRFPLKQLEKLTLRWPGRSIAFTHHPTPRGGMADWDLEPGPHPSGVDLSRIHALATDLSKLQTRRYMQYRGPFPPAAGLDHPRFQVEAALKGKAEPIVLRVGNESVAGEFYATVDPGQEGTLFLVTGPAWSAIITPPSESSSELPSDVFAPPPASK
jgi:hypothetical protein